MLSVRVSEPDTTHSKQKENQMSNKLLFDTQPLVILPELAVAVGLNEAIVLQQVHYWCELNARARRNQKDGYYWVYNSFPAWQKQFPW